MIDESTDVAVLTEMVIYVRYISPEAEVCTHFLTITELPDGTAEAIERTVTTYLEHKGLSIAQMVGFGSDGAAVMTGWHNGVGVRLKHKQPILISVHCVAHRLALAVSQSGESVSYISKTFKPTLRQLFYFFENSPVRMSGLKAIEQLQQTMELKLKKPSDTRWLSHDSAYQTLVKILPAVITSLEREAEERGQALAVGLCKVVKKYTFIATLYMLCDILPTISRLSCIFQSSTIDLSALDNLVSSTIESVQLLCSQAGNFARKLDSDLLSSLVPFSIHHSPEMKQSFQQHILQPFLNAIVHNIRIVFLTLGS